MLNFLFILKGDPLKIPNPLETNIHVHNWGLGRVSSVISRNDPIMALWKDKLEELVIRSLLSIVHELNHTKIDILKVVMVLIIQKTVLQKNRDIRAHCTIDITSMLTQY